MRRTVRAAHVALLAGALLLAGCGSSGSDAEAGADATRSAAGADAGPSGELMVFAAASLTEAFTELGTRFEQANPSASITFNFGPSSGLATQITAGAPADVFAAASVSTLEQVVAVGDAGEPVVFARNRMELAVPADNRAGITGLSDLERSDVKVALCQPDVPCGVGASAVFAAAGLTVAPVTLESDVKAVLTKVRLGEVDAGLVYVTDVLAAGDEVAGIEIPADVNAATDYPIATLSAAESPDLAAAFVDFVLSDDGATVLTAAGFERP
ncbi:molybdate ABC transporter substrate-binding protein [Pengzhenrongella sicca]|uniref:Molybdate ABC transporter substrate-binding protein n=1 Tax=Pengzhenrongella sicca TaxID=2819238 RepID=A0A8A4ZI28_9MICO|nr:molybdate ABC transporter substrate-binding protein [Pengzhenrongella sicca]QTE30176.1 molybdate ABC transporter substrate-binding protein [Pengzhenrongella sicca]